MYFESANSAANKAANKALKQRYDEDPRIFYNRNTTKSEFPEFFISFAIFIFFIVICLSELWAGVQSHGLAGGGEESSNHSWKCGQKAHACKSASAEKAASSSLRWPKNQAIKTRERSLHFAMIELHCLGNVKSNMLTIFLKPHQKLIRTKNRTRTDESQNLHPHPNRTRNRTRTKTAPALRRLVQTVKQNLPKYMHKPPPKVRSTNHHIWFDSTCSWEQKPSKSNKRKIQNTFTSPTKKVKMEQK